VPSRSLSFRIFILCPSPGKVRWFATNVNKCLPVPVGQLFAVPGTRYGMEMPLFLREEKLKVAHSFHTVEFANKCPGNLLTFFVADLSWLRGFSGKMETSKLLNLVARVVSTARSLLGFCFCDRQTESLIDSDATGGCSDCEYVPVRK
jgi:hypothetical protein